MSTLEVPSDVIADKVSVKIHNLPCKIDYSGTAQVDRFFTPLVRELKPGQFHGTFRGHPLEGTTINLPEGYRCVVARERNCQDDGGRRHVAESSAGSYTTWNWDKKPDDTDPAQRLNDWLQLSCVLHGDCGSDS